MREWNAANRKTWAELDPEQRQKEIARSYARVYRTRGHLLPKPCELCNTPEGVEMHHTDYSKPLEVHWLCRACHGWLHGLEGLERRRKGAAEAEEEFIRTIWIEYLAFLLNARLRSLLSARFREPAFPHT